MRKLLLILLLLTTCSSYAQTVVIGATGWNTKSTFDSTSTYEPGKGIGAWYSELDTAALHRIPPQRFRNYMLRYVGSNDSLYMLIDSVWVSQFTFTSLKSVVSDTSHYLPNGLATDHIFIGNSSGIATGRAVTGAVVIGTTGIISLADSAVTNAKIKNGAVTDAKLSLLYSKADGTRNYTGIVGYSANFGSSFVARSLIDKGYVDSVVTASGSGVTSVAMTMPGVIFNTIVPGSPITTSGTLAPTLITQTANTVFAGPVSGGVATPTMRALVLADIPGSIPYSKLSLTGAILNADLAGSIVYSKLSLTGAILNADLASGIDAAKITTGTLPDAQTAALTGNITKPAGSSVTTIAAGVVTNTMLAGGITVANGGTGTATSTGTTNVVLSNSPTLVTPVLGIASATSINKVALTAPATGSTLTIADGKTLAVNNTLTLAGTDATVMTFPTTNATIARTDAAQTFTGIQTYTGIINLNAVGGSVFSVGTANFAFRTTNGGSNVLAQSMFDVDNSITTPGSQAFGFETANGFIFTIANGSRRIVSAKMKLLNVVTAAGNESADLVFHTQSAGGSASEKFRITSAGGFTINSTIIAAGTTGAQTINKPSGQVNFAAAATTLVVTDALATTTSLIFTQVLGTDATMKTVTVTKAAGSFTLTANAAATAETAVSFHIFN